MCWAINSHVLPTCADSSWPRQQGLCYGNSSPSSLYPEKLGLLMHQERCPGTLLWFGQALLLLLKEMGSAQSLLLMQHFLLCACALQPLDSSFRGCTPMPLTGSFCSWGFLFIFMPLVIWWWLLKSVYYGPHLPTASLPSLSVLSGLINTGIGQREGWGSQGRAGGTELQKDTGPSLPPALVPHLTWQARGLWKVPACLVSEARQFPSCHSSVEILQ